MQSIRATLYGVNDSVGKSGWKYVSNNVRVEREIQAGKEKNCHEI